MTNNNFDHIYHSSETFPVFLDDWTEMKYTPQYTSFMLWAPTANRVKLTIYAEGTDTPAIEVQEMKKERCGKWEIKIDRNLIGKFYTFNVYKDGHWLGETPGVAAKAVGVNGLRGAIIDMNATHPDGWEKDKRPGLGNFADVIIYEMHHRDFSICSNSGMDYKGKFLALTSRCSKNPDGQSTGLSHLKELGITHVHLLPSFDFATVDESQPEKPQYNWGYDPLNYNVPEGSYSTNARNPVTRIREFKQMVQTLHETGIRVIMDVVYNHTYHKENSNFEKTVPGYFYRHTPDGNWSNGSGCSNETASERIMVRKFIIDSVCYWAKEYHIDGFRFDLMGIHDIDTMNAIRTALDKIDPSIIIYGEGWAACPPAYSFELLAMKSNTSRMKGIACFSDEMRDGLRAFSMAGEKETSPQEFRRLEALVKFGVTGGLPHPQLEGKQDSYPSAWTAQPTQMIGYISCHDDYCIGDFFSMNLPNTDTARRSHLLKLVETALFTSQCIPFLFAGDEMMRTRKGVKNTYNSPDSINQIDWRWKTEHFETYSYIRNLIALRKAHPAFRLGTAEQIYKYLEFIPAQNGVVAYRINGKPQNETWPDITVILNANREQVSIEVPQGEYGIVCYDGKINPAETLSTIKGGLLYAAAQSATIAYRISYKENIQE